jgi:hypothetical protein
LGQRGPDQGTQRRQTSSGTWHARCKAPIACADLALRATPAGDAAVDGRQDAMQSMMEQMLEHQAQMMKD